MAMIRSMKKKQPKPKRFPNNRKQLPLTGAPNNTSQRTEPAGKEYPRDMAEMALAHTVSDQVEAAYRRGDI